MYSAEPERCAAFLAAKLLQGKHLLESGTRGRFTGSLVVNVTYFFFTPQTGSRAADGFNFVSVLTPTVTRYWTGVAI